MVRTVVDTSTTYHLTIRRRTQEEMTEKMEHIEHERKHECGLHDGEGECHLPNVPPSQLIHVAVTISVDSTGSRSSTLLRSINPSELQDWWTKSYLKRSSLAARVTSESIAHELEGEERRLRATFQPLPLVIAAGGHPHISSSRIATLKVMSVNLWNYNYWNQRLDMLREILRRESADLIGFQEVRAVKSGPGRSSNGDTPNRWQVQDLQRMLPEYEYVYAPAMGFREGRDYVHEGLAIFSKYPILATHVLKLTRDPNDGQDFHQRICLHARVRTPSGVVNMLTTHLSLSLNARSRTLPEVSQFARGFATEPTVLVGDFNAQWNEGPQILTETRYGAFKDAWREKYPHADEAEGWTFNSWEHKSRIDFVLYKSHRGHTQPHLTVDDTRIVGGEGRPIPSPGLPPIGGVADMKDTMFPSDHMFLVTTFNVEPNYDHADHPTKKTTPPSTAGASIDDLRRAESDARVHADIAKDEL